MHGSDRGDFWAYSVEILVFASPTGYMLTSSGFPLLHWGIFYKFLKNDRYFSCSLQLQPDISQTQPVHLQLTAGSPQSLMHGCMFSNPS
jgi:hypothetical protein